METDISAAKDVYRIPAVTQSWILYSAKCNKLLPYPFRTVVLYFRIIILFYVITNFFNL